MSRPEKYDPLFQPLQIGPKTMRNRFWQVPHCNGAGVDRPGMQSRFRGMKAEGGWAVVFTEACSISPDSDFSPVITSKLWDEGDVRNLAQMCEQVHEHGSLAGVQLLHGNTLSDNADTRAPGRGVSQLPNEINWRGSVRALDKEELRDLRRDHVAAAERGRRAGFDLITLDAGLGNWFTSMMLPFHNQRADEYGGSFENRTRYARELVEDVREAIGDDCAVGFRFIIDNLDGYGDLGVRAEIEGRQFIAEFDDLTDYWDLHVGNMYGGKDAGSSRFFEMNHQRDYVKHAKQVSKKPVSCVGRFTDPDVMIAALDSGQCDIIGAARPSIADPFLPTKIEEGRFDDIRECIGCNVCLSRWHIGGPAPIWCTQNPTSGEEYRRGWHPERFSVAANKDLDVLVVGAGPSGMECAIVLAKRGMNRVHLVDRRRELGGHLTWMTKLPTLATWNRVVSYRQTQIEKLKNVEFIPGTDLDADAVRDYGAEIVVVATGSIWDGSGLTPTQRPGIPGLGAGTPEVVTPEQVVLEKKQLGERVLVLDTDGYHMGSTMALKFAHDGHAVTYVTPHSGPGPYLQLTSEQALVLERMQELGVDIRTQTQVVRFEGGKAMLSAGSGATEAAIEVEAVCLVTFRTSVSALYDQLKSDAAALSDAGIEGLYLIGDAWAPGMIAQSVFSGHRLAREIDSPDPSKPLPFIRDERRIFDLGETEYSLEAALAASSPPQASRAAG